MRSLLRLQRLTRTPFRPEPRSLLQRRTQCTTATASPPMSGFSYPAPRKLSDIAKLQLLDKHSSAQVSHIWREFHQTHKTAFADILSSSAYDSLQARSKRCPLFVIPVPRSPGFFSLLLQFQGRHALFTFLEDYKRNAPAAMPYMTITFFEDMLHTKGIALMRADITNQISKPEATIVWELVKNFYLAEGRNAFDAVVDFNENPANFNFDIVMRAAGIST